MYVKNGHLRSLIEKNCLLSDVNISLSTGTQSSFYFDCKKATLSGESLSLISDAILSLIDDFPERPNAIGGLTMGADPITAGVIARAFQMKCPPMFGSTVRKEPKKHGTKSKIENQLPEGTKIVVVDDVITSGRSIQIACDEFLAVGYIIVGIIAVIDRMAGGKEMLESKYAPVYTLFDKNDFPTLKSNDNSESTEAA